MVRGLRMLILEQKAENGCRRVLRDLETIQQHLAAVAPFAYGIPPPAIEGPTGACPGDSIPLRLPMPRRAGDMPVRTALECDTAVIHPTPDGGTLCVPLNAETGTVLTVTGRVELGPVGRAAVLVTRHQVAILAPVDFRLVVRSVDSETGVCTLEAKVRNNTHSRLESRVAISAPAGWEAAPEAHAAIDPGKTAEVALKLCPSDRALPGPVAIQAVLRARGAVFEESVRFLHIPPKDNRVRNPGFEHGAGGWGMSSGASGIAADDAADGKACVFLENRNSGDTTVNQTVLLKQKMSCPIWVRAASRAQNVTGTPGRGYSLYVDIYYMDGTPSYGHTWDFPTGTTTWQTGKVAIEPEKPIRNVNIYLLLRGKRGKAFFDDIALMEDIARKGNFARAARIAVDSSFHGYTPAPINDGRVYVDDLHWSEQAWASAESDTVHFVELAFDKPRTVGRGAVHWAVDAGIVETSREVLFQVADGKTWKTLARIVPPGIETRTVFRFAPVTAKRFRFLQPVGKGPKGRPGLMWVREIEVFPTDRQEPK